MSKKSRKRNKKILGALAAGLGAMALMKKKKAALSASVQDMDNAGLGVTHGTNWISKKSDTSPVDTSSVFPTRFSKPSQELISKGERSRALQAAAAKNKAMNYQRSQTFDARPKRIPTGSIDQFGTGVHFKHGGSVTGAAKRGFGRALMKGKK